MNADELNLTTEKNPESNEQPEEENEAVFDLMKVGELGKLGNVYILSDNTNISLDLIRKQLLHSANNVSVVETALPKTLRDMGLTDIGDIIGKTVVFESLNCNYYTQIIGAKHFFEKDLVQFKITPLEWENNKQIATHVILYEKEWVVKGFSQGQRKNDLNPIETFKTVRII